MHDRDRETFGLSAHFSNQAIKYFLIVWAIAFAGFFIWLAWPEQPAVNYDTSLPVGFEPPRAEPTRLIRSDNAAEDLRNVFWALSFTIGGLGAGVLMINALRRTETMERDLQLQEHAKDYDVFSRAVEQLGHEVRAVRLGAVFALKALMDEERSHFGPDADLVLQIKQTLRAYVRAALAAISS